MAETLENFIGQMNEARSINEDLKTMSQDSRTKERDGARKRIRNKAYDSAVTEGYVDKSKVPDESGLSEDFALNYASFLGRRADQDASNTLSGNLEKIIGEIDDSKLEKLVGAKEISEVAGKNYADWLAVYQAYKGAEDLVSRADDESNLKEKEREMLLAPAAKKAEEEKKKDMKDKGHDAELQRVGGALAQQAVLSGYKEVDYKAAAEAYRDEIGKKKKEIEATGKDARAYVTEGLKGLAGRGTDGFNTARELIYAAAKD